MNAYARSIDGSDPAGARANPGGLQESRLELPMAVPCATTDGGNTCLVNGDEAEALDNTFEVTPFRTGDLSMEDDSHVMGAWKAQGADFAGS